MTAQPVIVTRSGDWWWIEGDTYPHKTMLRQLGAKWSRTRQAWYFIGADLPTPIRTLVESKPEQEPSDPTFKPETVTHFTTLSTPESQAMTPNGVTQPIPSTALSIVPIQTPVIPTEFPAVKHGAMNNGLPQSFIGRVNVVGECYCYGVVVDPRPPLYRNIPIYLSVVGSSTSVEALWAKLSQGKQCGIIPDNRSLPSILLEPNRGGLYTRHQKKLDALGVDHLILAHEDLAAISYPTHDEKGRGIAYILPLSDEHRLAKITEHVRKTLKIPVMEHWSIYLYTQGRAHGLIRNCLSYGVDALALALDAAKWQTIITNGLQKQAIQLQQSTSD